MGVITSVSMSGTGSGIARPCTLVKRSISGHPGKRAWIGDVALDRGGGRGRDAGEVRARTGPLAADEVAVTCRNASLSRGDDLVVDGEAHRASRLAPFEAGCGEDAVESECLGLAPHALRSRHHPRAHALRHVPAANDLRGRLQVRETAVGAGAEEHVLDGHLLGAALDNRLRSEHMREIAAADAPAKRAESAVRTRMAVAAQHGYPRQ